MRLTDEQIGAELHALRETPSEQFAAELDAWAAEGFPTAKELEPSRRRPRFVLRRPVLAAAAGSLLVVAVVAVSVVSYLERNTTTTDSRVEPLSAVHNESLGDQTKNLDGTSGASSGVASAVAP